MKKKALPMAVGAATAVVMSTAQAAMYVNGGGTGEALVFPFYSAENGNTTNVSIVNTVSAQYTGTAPNEVEIGTGAWKAVKVRIIEGQNSAEVLDFNLYMSPRDHFSFAISATADGGGMLVTGDNSCTVPAIPAEGVEFRNYAYSTDLIAEDSDTDAPEYAGWDNTSIERSAVGYIEIIEMGQLDPNATAVLDTSTTGAINAAAAITHDSDGVPANCALLTTAWSINEGVPGKWRDEADSATTATSKGKGTSEMMSQWTGGGLYGYATVINVPQGASFGQDAVAIAELAGAVSGSAMHYKPGDEEPNFADPAIDTNAVVFNEGTTRSFAMGSAYPTGVAQLQAVNSLIMADKVHNDYVTDPVIAATTDWVLTFPTKKYHIEPADPIEPFSSNWDLKGYGTGSCEPVSLGIVDREESTPPIIPPGSDGPDFSPGPPLGAPPPAGNDDVPLCYETTVLQFADSTAAGTNSLAIGVDDYLEEVDGWATVSFDPADLDTTLPACDNVASVIGNAVSCERKITDGVDYSRGLPVVGFAVQKYVNGSAGGAGVLANYAMSTEHKTDMAISPAGS